MSYSSDSVKESFLTSGYLEAGISLLAKLSLNNKNLKSLSFLNPDRRMDEGSVEGLQHLATLFKHILSDSEEQNEQAAVLEIYVFVANNDFLALNRDSVEVGWERASSFPLLQKVAKAALSLFHGPQVEGYFSSMKNIMKKKSGRMQVDLFSSYQTVKYHLRGKKLSSTQGQ